MVDILESKVVGTNKETWYKLVGTSEDTKPIGEFPAGTGHTVAKNSTFFEIDTQIKYEFDGSAYAPKGQVDIKLIEKEVAPAVTAQVFVPADDNADGYSSVTVSAVTSDIDANIVAENIKEGVSILGIEGIISSDNNAKFIASPSTTFSMNNLSKITIPEGIVRLASDLFKYSVIEDVVFPSTLQLVSSNAFYGCQHLESIELPDSVGTIASAAFSNCTSLKSVKLSNNLKSILESAFANCAFTSIEIPASVTSIGTNAFSNNNLETITINKPEGSISGAPWGATNAEVIWTG